MLFVEEHPGGEEGDALTKGPETWVPALALWMKWKGQHSFLNLRFLISKTGGHNLTRLFED